MTASETRTPERESIFRGNAGLILGSAILASVLTGPGQTIGVSVFIDHFVDDLNLSRSQVSTAYLIGTLTGSVFLPSVGRFVDRRGVRVAQTIIGILFALALVNMSFVRGFITLAIGFTGIRLLGQGSLSLVSTVTVALRFVKNRGTAVGTFSTVTAGMMAFVPIVLAAVISAVGWRGAWLVAALGIALTVGPLAWFGLRSMPTAAAQTDSGTTTADFTGFTRKDAISTRGFWILAAISAAAGMLSTALNFHQIDLLTQAGLSAEGAAAMFLPQVLGSTAAGFAAGYAADRIGTRFLPALSVALLFFAHLLAANASPGFTVVVYAITLGAAGGATRTVAATLLPSWFGTTNLGSIQGTLTFFNVGASAIGPVALALLEARFGSYPEAILVLSTIPLAAFAFALLRPFSKEQRTPQPVGLG